VFCGLLCQFVCWVLLLCECVFVGVFCCECESVLEFVVL